MRLRLAAGRSQRDQAPRIGVSRTTLIHAETGRPVMISSARRIAEFYDRPVDALFPDLLEACSS